MTDRLERIAPDLFIADGPSVSFFGFPYPTRMAVAVLPDGLFVWSPVEPDEALLDEVRALGEVRWIVEPNPLHHLFLPAWLAQFPDARAYAAPGLREKRPDIEFAGELGDVPEPEWADQIDQLVLRSPVFAEVFFFHRPSSTCLVCDFIQRHDEESFAGWKGWLMKADGLVGEHGSTPRELRATFLKRGPGREALERALAWRPERLIIAHGECALEHGSEVLEDGLSWLTRPWPA